MSFLKNISVSLIALVFVFFNSGLMLNVHYCEGNLESVTSVFQESETCGEHSAATHNDDYHEELELDSCCSKQTLSHDSCCSDDVLVFQDSSEKISSNQDDYSVSPIAIPVSVFLLTEIKSFQDVIKKSNDRYSFESNAPPLYRLYCKYTYFG